MNLLNFRRTLPRLAALVLCVLAFGGARAALAQQQQGPLTNEEFLAVVRQLPQRPALKDQLVSEIRRRGINFTLTSGLRSFVATKSGNDEELRRVLEEAERRFLNPTVAKALPSSAEAADLLQKTRAATLDATDQMPDFVVKQLVTRSHAAGRTQNWVTDDRLVIGVSFRESQGEKYRLLAINGIANASAQADEQSDYTSVGGTSSTGEFVTQLKELFDEHSKTDFKFVDEETLRGRRTLVFDFEIKRENSRLQVGYGKERAVIAGQRGRVWIDRERARILRVERAATEMPADFPVTASDQAIDYDWVTIQGQGDYLLPARAVLVMTAAERGRVEQSRNDIRFRNYQKFGSELKIIDDDIIDDAPPEKPKKP